MQRFGLPPDHAVPAGPASPLVEIRYLDSIPDAVWPAVVFTLVTLLDDPAAADIAAEATESVATAWDRAAQIGLGDRRLARPPSVVCGPPLTGARRTRGIDAAIGAFGRTGTVPGRRFLRPGREVPGSRPRSAQLAQEL